MVLICMILSCDTLDCDTLSWGSSHKLIPIIHISVVLLDPFLLSILM